MQAALDAVVARVLASTEFMASPKARKMAGGAKASAPTAAGSSAPAAVPLLSAGTLGEQETVWVSKLVSTALGSAVTGMGIVLEERFINIEAELVKQNQHASANLTAAMATRAELVELNRKVGALTAKLAEVQGEQQTAEAVLTGRLTEAEKALEDVATQARSQGQPPGLQAQPSPVPGIQDLPYEARTTAILGNLGWDDKGADLLAEARRILALAGVDVATYDGLSAMANRQDEGSAAALVFRSPGELQKAKLLVRAVALNGLQGKLVWLDARKTRLELKPARIIHRAAQMLADFEGALAPASQLEITKMMAAKYLCNNNGRILYTLRGKIFWAPEGVARYTAEQRDIVAGFAEE